MLKTMPSAKNIEEVLAVLRKHHPQKSMLAEFSGQDPFIVLISTVLSARNRDEMTLISVQRLFSKYRTPEEISAIPLQELEIILRETGFYRIKARRIKDISKTIISRHNGEVPDSMEGLLKLPGVGRKTAGCVLVYAFGKPAIPVDTHVHKISNRLGWVKTKDPLETEQELMKIIPKKLWTIVNDVMVLHGRSICTPISPHCSICPVEKLCRKMGVGKSR